VNTPYEGVGVTATTIRTLSTHKASPLPCRRVDGKLTTRPDIMAVRKHGKYLLTVPARIYALRSPMNRDLAKLPLMNYFECEFRLKQELYKKLYA
jgi:hypothetical protein